MYGLRPDSQNNVNQQSNATERATDGLPLASVRLDYKRPKETLSVIKINLSQNGQRASIKEERVNPLYEWCKSKGISAGEIVKLTRVFGQKEPSRDSVHVHLDGSPVRKLSEATIRDINRAFKESGFKLFALKLVGTEGGDNLLLYLKNGEEFLVGLKPVAYLSEKTPKVQKYRIESELNKIFHGRGIGLELAL